MHICYLDDSGDENARAFSLLSVPAENWKECFAAMKGWRTRLRASDGIFIRKELHATKFLSGRGYVAQGPVSLARRCEIFRDCLRAVTGLPGVRLFNAIGRRQNEMLLFERLLNRLNRALTDWQSLAICVSDEGKDYTHLVRRMRVFNPIPSKYGHWGGGQATRNIPLDRLLDDLFYRRSHESYFVQAADFVAYALLRSEVHHPAKDALGLHTAFDIVAPCCQTQSFRADPRGLGIIRDT